MGKLLLLSTLTAFFSSSESQGNGVPPKLKFLIHVTTGADNPTKAALAFLVAKTALQDGHVVNIFLAGDAVLLLKDSNLSTINGLGTGNLKEHYDAIVAAGGKFYLSGNSSKARGMTEKDLEGKPASFALPNILVNLAAESDRMFTY